MEEQSSKNLNAFMDHLRDLENGPPFLAIFFVATLFLLGTFIRSDNFYIFLAIFLFSLFGIIWRHAIRDTRDRIKAISEVNFPKNNLQLILVYHFVNLIFLGVLIYIIVRYCI